MASFGGGGAEEGVGGDSDVSGAVGGVTRDPNPEVRTP